MTISFLLLFCSQDLVSRLFQGAGGWLGKRIRRDVGVPRLSVLCFESTDFRRRVERTDTVRTRDDRNGVVFYPVNCGNGDAIVRRHQAVTGVDESWSWRRLTLEHGNNGRRANLCL